MFFFRRSFDSPLNQKLKHTPVRRFLGMDQTGFETRRREIVFQSEEDSTNTVVEIIF
jgi:hypothetical protein